MDTTYAFAFAGQFLKNVPLITAPSVGASRFSCGAFFNIGAHSALTYLMGLTAAVSRAGFAVLTLVRSTVTIAATAHTGALGIAAQLARRAAAVHRTAFTVLAQVRSTLTVTATTGTAAHGIATYLAGCAATIHRTDLAVLGLLPSAHTVSADGKHTASEKQDKKHQGKSWNDSADGHGCLRNKEMHRYSLKTYAGYPMTATVSRCGHLFTPL